MVRGFWFRGSKLSRLPQVQVIRLCGEGLRCSRGLESMMVLQRSTNG